MEMPKEIAGGFRARPRDAHKRSVGTVTVVGGSHGFPHAPVIAGLGARAAGAGLVRLVVPEESRPAAGALLPEATVSDLGGDIPLSDVTVVGPGLGLGEEASTSVRDLLCKEGRLVVDADALTHLAAICKLGSRDRGATIVLTPHEGEAARLLGVAAADISRDRRSAAKEIARRYRATVVLKGPGTLVVSPDGEKVYENSTGNPFMALGGMGDLLSGVVAARWAYLGGDAFLPAAASAWIHGAAGDALVADVGDMSIANMAARIGSMRILLDRMYSTDFN
jgi:NAD(P)H-hydrate epimerase